MYVNIFQKSIFARCTHFDKSCNHASEFHLTGIRSRCHWTAGPLHSSSTNRDYSFDSVLPAFCLQRTHDQLTSTVFTKGQSRDLSWHLPFQVWQACWILSWFCWNFSRAGWNNGPIRSIWSSSHAFAFLYSSESPNWQKILNQLIPKPIIATACIRDTDRFDRHNTLQGRKVAHQCTWTRVLVKIRLFP